MAVVYDLPSFFDDKFSIPVSLIYASHESKLMRVRSLVFRKLNVEADFVCCSFTGLCVPLQHFAHRLCNISFKLGRVNHWSKKIFSMDSLRLSRGHSQ